MGTLDDPWETVAAINEAWTVGDLEDLADLFHQDMVIAGPDLVPRGVGRAACIAGYREFLDRAVVSRLTVEDRHVHIVGDTAVASYRFRLEYRLDGDDVVDAGADVFVLIREDGRWQAVWRLLSVS